MRTTFLLSFICIAFLSYSQSDTIFKTDGELLAVNVTEVNETAVKFVYPGEDFSNSVSKNAIEKIYFKSGRVQEFSSSLNLRQVKGCLDWENVQISRLESEIQGLNKLDMIGAKAKGLTTLSSLGKLQDRAYDKLKIQTAMLGGNVVYLLEQNTEEAVFGNEYSSSKTPGVTLSALAYSSKKVSANEIKFANYNLSAIYVLRTNSYGMKRLEIKPWVIRIDEREVWFDNGFPKIRLTVEGVKKVNEFTIIYADQNMLVLSGIDSNKRSKRNYFNVILTR